MKASAKVRGVRISPQKARLVVDQIRGQKVNQALLILEFSTKKAAPIIRKVLMSAVANAEDKATTSGDGYIDIDELKVVTAFVDQGIIMKRTMPRARGRADRIFKRSSHVTIELSDE
ncbi:MAG: 50S ribosomal protein L22 [Pseudomonadota bacterium]